MAQWSVKRGEHFNPSNNNLHEVVMVADKDGNILNTSGAASNIPLAAGQVTGYKHVHKFGATDGDVTSGVIWDGNDNNDTYPGPITGTPEVNSLNNVGDIVVIEGLDLDFNEQTEEVAIGDTATLSFGRVFRAYMLDTINISDVTINMAGIPVNMAIILAGNGQTLMAVYTVPAGKTAYLLELTLGSDKASTNSAMTYSLIAREDFNGGVPRIKGRFNSAGGQNIRMEYPVPLQFLEKTDIRIDVEAAQAASCSATFDLILVDNIL